MPISSDGAGVRRKNFLAAGAATAALAVTVPNIVLGAPEPIRVGLIPPITGANALLGQQEQDGVKLAVDEINARPDKVYAGRPFEIVTEDATNDNQSAVAALNKILGENIEALLAPVLSTQIQAMAPVMKSHAIPWLTGGTAVKNTQLGVPGLFRLRASDAITAAAMTAFAVQDQHAKRPAILHASDAFGTGGADQIVANLKKFSLDPVANEQFPKDTKDFTAEILKCKSANCDALLMYIQNPSDTAVILQQIRSLGLKVPIIGSPSLGNQTALEIAKASADGCYVGLDFIVGAKSDIGTRFVETFTKQFGHAPDVGSGSGWIYDGVYLLARAYAQQKGTDPATTIATLRATKDYLGVLGTFSCDAEGNMIHQISIGRIEDAKVTLVKKVSA
jgi:branched-chain amino acid transport system substrate-binding protein